MSIANNLISQYLMKHFLLITNERTVDEKGKSKKKLYWLLKSFSSSHQDDSFRSQRLEVNGKWEEKWQREVVKVEIKKSTDTLLIFKCIFLVSYFPTRRLVSVAEVKLETSWHLPTLSQHSWNAQFNYRSLLSSFSLSLGSRSHSLCTAI